MDQTPEIYPYPKQMTDQAYRGRQTFQPNQTQPNPAQMPNSIYMNSQTQMPNQQPQPNPVQMPNSIYMNSQIQKPNQQTQPDNAQMPNQQPQPNPAQMPNQQIQPNPYAAYPKNEFASYQAGQPYMYHSTPQQAQEIYPINPNMSSAMDYEDTQGNSQYMYQQSVKTEGDPQEVHQQSMNMGGNPSPFEQFQKPLQPNEWYPAKKTAPAFQQVPQPNGLISYFKDENGELDFDKVFQTVGQVTTTIQQVSPVVKQISSIVKAFSER